MQVSMTCDNCNERLSHKAERMDNLIALTCGKCGLLSAITDDHEKWDFLAGMFPK